MKTDAATKTIQVNGSAVAISADFPESMIPGLVHYRTLRDNFNRNIAGVSWHQVEKAKADLRAALSSIGQPWIV